MTRVEILLSKLITEANNMENSESGRNVCMKAAEFVEQQISRYEERKQRPMFKQVPWAETFVACCPKCDAELETENANCPKCGAKITWRNF